MRKVLACGVVLVACLMAHHGRLSGQAVGPRLNLDIVGGYAFIENRVDGRLEFGPMVEGADEHQMRLRIPDTAVVEVEPRGSIELLRSGTWSLHGLDVTIAGAAPGMPVLPPNGATGGPPPNDGDWDNRYWIPQPTRWAERLDDGATFTLRGDWSDHLNSRVTLTGGRVEVRQGSDPRYNNLTYDRKVGDAVFDRRKLTNRIHYSAPLVDGAVTFVMSRGGQEVGRLTVRPRDPSMSVAVTIDDTPENGDVLGAGQPFSHFAMFYGLVEPEPEPARQLIPYVPEDFVLSSERNVLGGSSFPTGYCIGAWFVLE